MTVVDGEINSVAEGFNFLLIFTVNGRCVLDTTPRAPEIELNIYIKI